MSKTEDKSKKYPWLIFSLLSNLLILITFKYYGFFVENLNLLLTGIGFDDQIPVLKLILPMGISFYTFQTMSYSIDVYRGTVKAERHFGIFLLYVLYFPQLVAGPIERAGHLLGKFRERITFDYDRISWGIRLMIWGFFKKVVIADRLGQFVDPIYDNPALYDGAALLLATYFFAFQIYCDFSGYSDIAIGCSRIFGIELMQNFKLPYFSSSISGFWSRWHISLSTWFRDYLYIPLGGNRVIKWRWYYNLFIVFLISGFWHGSEWTFLAWGALHGIYLILEHSVFSKISFISKIPKWIKVIFIFHLVLISWIFFRANTISDALLVFSSIIDFSAGGFMSVIGSFPKLTFLFFMVLFIAFIFFDPYFDKKLKQNKQFTYTANLIVFSFIVSIIMIFGFFGSVQFIYFQF